MQITTIGLDIAKHVFQVHGIDAAEKVVVRKRLRRGQVMKFFEALPPCLIGMSEGSRELLISTQKTESEGVLVAVRDSGPGLTPDSADRLFESFYTTKPGGLGMGPVDQPLDYRSSSRTIVGERKHSPGRRFSGYVARIFTCRASRSVELQRVPIIMVHSQNV
jgi:hypothetical protein